MDVSAEPIAAGMGKGRDEKCEVVGQDLFVSPTGRRLSTVARVCVRSAVTGHSTTDVMTPVAWLWCRRLPVTHGLRVFDALELKFTPSKFVLCVELTF